MSCLLKDYPRFMQLSKKGIQTGRTGKVKGKENEGKEVAFSNDVAERV